MDRRSIIDYLRDNAISFSDININNKIYDFIARKDTKFDLSDHLAKIASFVFQARDKWKKANRTKGRFDEQNKEWLDSVLFFLKHKSPGRPHVSFTDASVRTKDKAVTYLLENFTTEQLLYATSKSLKRDKRFNEAQVVKQIFICDYNVNTQPTSLSAEQALALIIDINLSKAMYQHLRNTSSQLYPSYHKVKEAKVQCYPREIKVDDYSAETSLQNLLNHTATRLCLAQEDVLTSELASSVARYSIIYKIGFDGASGQSVYKQKPDNMNSFGGYTIHEESLFLTCIVPLELYFFKNGRRQVAWRNPRPSSTAYCRPFRFQYAKETTELILNEFEKIKSEIEDLHVSNINLSSGTLVQVQHIVNITMIDGKVQTVISTATNSTQSCSVCGATPKEINNLSLVAQKNVELDNIKHGVSTLHAWIRLLENMLHIGYKMPLKTWQARGPQEKEIVAARKNEIKVSFKEKMGLVMDQPRSGGAGTSNDGNTARRFFQQSELSAQILGLNADLLGRLHTILAAMSSGFFIDTLAFKNFCWDTAQLYVALYQWYPMCQTLHKILIHGHTVIDFFILPLGVLSEESQEASNKIFKKFRENFTRKCRRPLTNLDLFQRLLCASDPFIRTFCKAPTTKKFPLPPATLSLLKEPSLSELL